jgi:hypothetical protein
LEWFSAQFIKKKNLSFPLVIIPLFWSYCRKTADAVLLSWCLGILGLRSRSLHPRQLLDLPILKRVEERRDRSNIFWIPKDSSKRNQKKKKSILWLVTTNKNFPFDIQSPVGKNRVLLNRFSMNWDRAVKLHNPFNWFTFSIWFSWHIFVTCLD